MKYISIILCLTILGGWLFCGASMWMSTTRKRGGQQLLTFLAGTFISIGGLGFFGSALMSLGAFNWLPPSFEWPVGHSAGVVTTKDGYRVVPHTPTSRIQIYEADWKFLRGWNVDVSGGIFKLYVTDTNHINVVTARRQMHYIYDLNGALLSSESYAATGTGYSAFPQEGVSYEVPTPLWLWVFTNPFHSWIVAVAGLLCFIALDKVAKHSATNPSAPGNRPNP